MNKEINKILNLLKNQESFPVDFSDELLFLFREKELVNNVVIYWNFKSNNIEIEKTHEIKTKTENNRLILLSFNFKKFLKKDKVEELFYKRFIGDLESGEELDKIIKRQIIKNLSLYLQKQQK